TSSGGPLGTAHEASTPPRSRRKSQCRRRASWRWITKIGLSLRSGSPRGNGSGVRWVSRFARYLASAGSCAPSPSSPSLRSPPSTPPGRRGGEHLHRVDSVLDPLEHLPVGRLLQARLLQFFPGPGRGDHRPRPTPQGERADRCLRRVVLTPIDEHLAPPQLFT